MEKIQCKITKGVPYPLGATKENRNYNFAVSVKGKADCQLILFDRMTGEEVCTLPFSKENRIGSVYTMCIHEFPYEQFEYCFEIDQIRTLDPYARVLTGERDFGTNLERKNVRCAFLSEYDWQGECAPQIPIEDVVLYRLHVRGFTKHLSSKVTARGTFQGIREKIPYLKQLGVNQIELMPVYEFQDCFPKSITFGQKPDKKQEVRCNFWGYAPYNYYYALKEQYAYTSSPVTEFKDLVRDLHENHMEIVLEFYFPEQTDPILITECLCYWYLEYHVDGFHISGSNLWVEHVARQPILSNVKLYAQYFAYDTIYEKNEIPPVRHLAVSADDYALSMRSFLKGDAGKTQDVAYFLRRNQKVGGFVNYLTSHDGFTMLDLVSYEEKHNLENGEDNVDGNDYNYSWNCGVEGKTRRQKVLDLRARQMRNAWMILLLSQGIPAILAGDELCNTQHGNNNAYCQDNETGWVNWKPLKVYEGMEQYVRTLLQFRRTHPIFHHNVEMKMIDYEAKGFPDISYHGEKAWKMEFRYSDRHMGVLYCGNYGETAEGAEDAYLYLAFNMDCQPQKFGLPKLPKHRNWYLCLDSGEEVQPETMKVIGRGSTLEVKERTCLVLVGK